MNRALAHPTLSSLKMASENQDETNSTEEENTASSDVEEAGGGSEAVQYTPIELPQELPPLASVQPEVIHRRSSYGRSGQELSK